MARFQYVDRVEKATGPMPLLRLTLQYRRRSLDATGVVDSGASISVVPYYLGLALGAVWDEGLQPFPVAGTLGMSEGLGIRLSARHPRLNGGYPLDLVFAWVRSDEMPIVFGQMSFFLEFDICFYRSLECFDVHRRQTE